MGVSYRTRAALVKKLDAAQIDSCAILPRIRIASSPRFIVLLP
jgi:hypothetical protein